MKTSSLQIQRIASPGHGRRGEYVEIVNVGLSPALLTTIKLVNEAADDRQLGFVYCFPSLGVGKPLELGREQHAYVFTGNGADELGDDGWLLFAGEDERKVWRPGETAHLQDITGRVIDSHMIDRSDAAASERRGDSVEGALGGARTSMKRFRPRVRIAKR